MQLIDYLHISNNQFAKKIDISSSRMSNIATFRNKPDSEMLQAIAEKFTNVSMDWLLIGSGSMLKAENSVVFSDMDREFKSKNDALICIIAKKEEKLMKITGKAENLKNEIEVLRSL